MKISYKQIIILIFIAILIFMYQFIFIPGKKKLNSLREEVIRKSDEYKLLKSLCKDYQMKMSQNSVQIKFAEENFSLISFLGKMGLKENIKEVKPLLEEKKDNLVFCRVKISIENITLEKLIGFLQKVESENFIYIPTFQMKRNKDKPFLLNTEMELLVIKSNIQQN